MFLEKNKPKKTDVQQFLGYRRQESWIFQEQGIIVKLDTKKKWWNTDGVMLRQQRC